MGVWLCMTESQNSDNVADVDECQSWLSDHQMRSSVSEIYVANDSVLLICMDTICFFLIDSFIIIISAPPLHLQRCSLAFTALDPLVLNFSTQLATHLQRRMEGVHSASPRARAALANPHDHPEGIRMPHVKFRANPLKTVAMHKEQRN